MVGKVCGRPQQGRNFLRLCTASKINMKFLAAVLHLTYVGLHDQKPFITLLLFFSFFVSCSWLPVHRQCCHFPNWPGTRNLDTPRARDFFRFSSFLFLSFFLSFFFVFTSLSFFSHSVCLTVSAFCMPCDYRRMYSSRLVITFLARCGLLEKRAYMPFLSLSFFAYCIFETSLGILVQFYAAHP